MLSLSMRSGWAVAVWLQFYIIDGVEKEKHLLHGSIWDQSKARPVLMLRTSTNSTIISDKKFSGWRFRYES